MAAPILCNVFYLRIGTFMNYRQDVLSVGHVNMYYASTARKRIRHIEVASIDIASVINKFHADNASAGSSYVVLRDNNERASSALSFKAAHLPVFLHSPDPSLSNKKLPFCHILLYRCKLVNKAKSLNIFTGKGSCFMCKKDWRSCKVQCLTNWTI